LLKVEDRACQIRKEIVCGSEVVRVQSQGVRLRDRDRTRKCRTDAQECFRTRGLSATGIAGHRTREDKFTTDREGVRTLRETERVRPLRERAICRARRSHAEVVDIGNSRTRGGACTQSGLRRAHYRIEETLVDLRIGVIERLSGGCSVALAGSEQAASFVERRCTKPRILFSAPTEFIRSCW